MQGTPCPIWLPLDYLADLLARSLQMLHGGMAPSKPSTAKNN